jgi:ParB family chromosome partitioning protein
MGRKGVGRMEKVKMINVKDLLGVEDEPSPEEKLDKQVETIKLDQLVPFKNHPFKLYEGKRLDDMIESIKKYGVLVPLVIRPIENSNGKYEILSGHNRKNAAQIAGIKELSKEKFVIMKGLTDEEAMLVVTETNLIQRSFADLSHSERATVLAAHYNAIKSQGRRTDLINEIERLSNADNLEESSAYYQLDKMSKSNEKLGEKYDLSPASISRYLRIDMLIDELKTRIDSGEIPFMAGVDLSFLKEEEQKIVESIIDNFGYKMDLKKSDVLKSLSKGRNFNYDKANEVLSGKYFNKPKKAKSFKFTSKFKKNISKYFKEDQPQNEIEKTIEEALELYFENQNH